MSAKKVQELFITRNKSCEYDDWFDDDGRKVYLVC